MDIDALELDRNPFALPPEAIWALRESGLTTGLWPVDTPSGRCLLAVTPARLTVFSTTGAGTRSWNLLHDVTVSERALSFHLGQPSDGRTYHLVDPGHADEIAAAASGAAGDNVRRVTADGQTLYTRSKEASLDGTRRSARDVVAGYAVFGVILQVVGFLTLLGAGASADDPDSSSNEAFQVIGWLVTTVGGICLLIAIAAYGSRLALKWRDQEKAAG